MVREYFRLGHIIYQSSTDLQIIYRSSIDLSGQVGHPLSVRSTEAHDTLSESRIFHTTYCGGTYFLDWMLYYADPAQHLRVAGWDLYDISVDDLPVDDPSVDGPSVDDISVDDLSVDVWCI